MVSRAKLQTFLRSHKLQSKRTKPNESNPITHTRMGHTDHNIIPGSYSIPDAESDTFHDWAEEQPKWVQDALYENADDPASVVRVIDLYKSDKGNFVIKELCLSK